MVRKAVSEPRELGLLRAVKQTALESVLLEHLSSFGLIFLEGFFKAVLWKFNLTGDIYLTIDSKKGCRGFSTTGIRHLGFF